MYIAQKESEACRARFSKTAVIWEASFAKMRPDQSNEDHTFTMDGERSDHAQHFRLKHVM